MADRRVLRAGKVGSSGRVKLDDKEFAIEDRRRNTIPEDPEPMDASIGFQAGISMSTPFARQKVEVSAWCTLPTYPDRESRQVMLDECVNQVLSELDSRLDEVAKRYFPHANFEEKG